MKTGLTCLTKRVNFSTDNEKYSVSWLAGASPGGLMAE